MASLSQCVFQVSRIESEVALPVNFKTHEKLSLKLDHVKDELESVPNQGPFLKNLKEQIIDLYGKIDNSLISYELKRIQKEAEAIDSSLQKGKRKNLSQITRSLKNHIAALWDHYRPNLEERRVIVFAEEVLKKAQNIETKTTDLSWEEKQAVEEALEGIGMALAEKDDKRSAFFFNSLTKKEQECLCSYLPQEEASSLIHQIKRAGHNNKIFLRQR